MKKSLLLLLIIFFINSCSDIDPPELIFRKGIQNELNKSCGDNSECKQAVSEQIKGCMELAGWRDTLQEDPDGKIMEKFIEKFDPCFKDKNGNPLF